MAANENPIVVCGVDFSGTSMVSDMIGRSGVDMGDFQRPSVSAPFGYETFECAILKQLLSPLHKEFAINIAEEWVDRMYRIFLTYYNFRQTECYGRQGGWGVKNNGLVFLGLHPKVHDLPVRWVTTTRPLQDSMQSAFRKMGERGEVAAMIGIEHLAHTILMREVNPYVVRFNELMSNPQPTARRLSFHLHGNDQFADFMAGHVDPIGKGIKHDHPYKGVGTWTPNMAYFQPGAIHYAMDICGDSGGVIGP